ncbi:unnamed protein product [Brachionus calyciflorus]|uniref:Phosphoribulokinase/uridine kinase domain-containing protein n=1 Tax=Brachionus calyciflorus TaxID=104777 RepID=A0A813VE13_9BILA|nr:unnamed protein product [Brachionus calyciflorus]
MFIIGISGLSCSGKTTFSEKLCEALGKENCLLMSLDDYYKELTEEQYKILHNDEASINFDCPEAIDYEQLINHITSIRNNIEISIPKFDLGSCVVTRFENVKPNQYKFIVLEGVFIFNNEVLKKLFNLTIWIETCDYACALRRFIKYTKDIQGYNPEYTYNQCIKHVIPGQEKYIKPYRSGCDVLINGEKEDSSIVDMVVYLVKQKSNYNLAN